MGVAPDQLLVDSVLRAKMALRSMWNSSDLKSLPLELSMKLIRNGQEGAIFCSIYPEFEYNSCFQLGVCAAPGKPEFQAVGLFCKAWRSSVGQLGPS